eukprot:1161851-Pelagomonas_calceolata.AAC.5
MHEACLQNLVELGAPSPFTPPCCFWICTAQSTSKLGIKRFQMSLLLVCCRHTSRCCKLGPYNVKGRPPCAQALPAGIIF